MSNTQRKKTKQPKGLTYLFFAEMWERFSFYGMRALLTLYMAEHLLFSDEKSFGIFAAYGSLVYATPLIGGILSDKILGYRKAIILGGILMAIGHFVLAIENDWAFYSAMAFLIVGNGFFKPNISSMVGSLYEKDDPRRESGFTLFYLGINVGGMLAPLVCGWVGAKYGWHYGFALAGFGMLLGLIVFVSGMRKGVFLDHGLVPFSEKNSKKVLGLNNEKLVGIGALLFIPLIALLVKNNEYEHYIVTLLTMAITLVLAYIFYHSTKVEKGRLMVLVYFTLLATLFWAVFEQGGSSLTLFAKRNVDLVLLNASQTNSINSFFIIVLALFFSWMWRYLSSKGKNPNSPLKFGLGLLFVGIGFIVFGYSGQFANTDALVPMGFLILGYFLYTLGEMFISPIGLSKVTELSPAKYLSFLMGVWFLSSFYGHYFAGKIAKLTTINPSEKNMFSMGIIHDLAVKIGGATPNAIPNDQHWQQLYSYTTVFSTLGIIMVVIGVCAMLLSPFIRKLMRGIH